ncbi:MAG TPA: glycosyltransferase [Anaerolineales bacterium]|nr:glycosyltransferase [Anaerolineales bacterium]
MVEQTIRTITHSELMDRSDFENRLFNLEDIVNNPISRPTVSVIIPTLNEAQNLPLVLPYLPMNWIDEVILVDGRSTDNTIEVARKLLPSIKVVTEMSKGKGAALRAGYRASRGDILAVIDADGSNDPRELPRYITALLEGADFVKGTRFAPGGGTTDMPRIRMLGNDAFVVLSNVLFGVKFTDLCYGFHAFWRYCLDSLALEAVNGFEIDTAIYLQAVRARLRIVEVPSFEGYRFFGVGKLQTIPDGLRVVNTVFHQWLELMHDINKGLPMGFRGIKYARPALFESCQPLSRSGNLTRRVLGLMQLLSMTMFTGEETPTQIQQLLQLTLEAVQADSGSIILLDENGDFNKACLASESGFQTPDRGAWAEVLKSGLAGWAIKNRESVLVCDTHDDPRWLQREWDKKHRSAIALPLFAGGMVIGALTLVRPNPLQFTHDDLNLLQSNMA